MSPLRSLAALAAALLAGCASTPMAEAAAPKPSLPPLAPVAAPEEPKDPAPRTTSAPVLLRNAKVMTAAGTTYERGHVLMAKGRIVALGEGPGEAPEGATVIDLEERVITPGLIDTHSHMGVYPLPQVQAHQDGNEMSRPVTAEVWAEHSFWPQDPALWRALSGGVTTIQVLPGSANLIGGRTFVAKLRPGVSAREMRFPGAPQGLKMACGENPKRVYGQRGGAPQTRMGNVAGQRAVFQRALEYKRRREKYQRDLVLWQQRHELAARGTGKRATDKPDDPPEPPARDLGLETLAKVLSGEILVHNHCYRADEMSLMLDLAAEFGFRIRSFHHALEAYKLRHRLKQEDVSISTWADWWGFKMEAYDGIPQNVSLLEGAGVRAILHSDSETEIRHLNQEAEKARTAGRKVGLEATDDQALRWITANAAWALGVEDQVGTLEPGKMADVVVWDRTPFSVYARAMQVYIDGELVYDLEQELRPRSDFEEGLLPDEVTK